MGVALALTTSDQSLKHGPVFQFRNMGHDSGNQACFLIREMMDGIQSNKDRIRLEADIQIADIEREQENIAIQMSLAFANSQQDMRQEIYEEEKKMPFQQ